MNPNQLVEEQILLTVVDQSKLDLVMELLSHFDLVRAERVKAQPVATATPNVEKGSEADFWALAGLWEGRDIDAQKLRQQTWKRASGNQL